MASSRDQYETRLVRRAKDARKLARQGWEIVSTSGKEGGIMGSNLQIVLRRPNPNYVDPETRAEEWNRVVAERNKRKQERKQERAERKAQKEEREAVAAQTVAGMPAQTANPPPHTGPPNWYPDPNGTPGLLRYWDGASWTEHTHEQSGAQQPSDQHPPKKSWYRRWWVWAIAGILFLAWIGALVDKPEGEDTAVEATTTATEASETPSVAPTTPEPTPEEETTVVAEPEPTEEEPLALPDDEALAAVDAYLAERASDGVLMAEVVSETSLSDGRLTVVFDPEGAGYEHDLFEELNPFDNLAEFVGTPFCFANDESARIRTRINDVATEYPSGESLGSATVAELYELCTGDQLDE